MKQKICSALKQNDKRELDAYVNVTLFRGTVSLLAVYTFTFQIKGVILVFYSRSSTYIVFKQDPHIQYTHTHTQVTCQFTYKRGNVVDNYTSRCMTIVKWCQSSVLKEWWREKNIRLHVILINVKVLKELALKVVAIKPTFNVYFKKINWYTLFQLFVVVTSFAVITSGRQSNENK